MNGPEGNVWIDRSGQRWKLRAANVALIGGVGLGLYLFFQATWPGSFHGVLIAFGASTAAIVFLAVVRCPVCDRRVALDASFGAWWTYAESLQTCPMCGDDGTNRPVSPAELPVWFGAVRKIAVEERARRQRRRRRALRVVGIAAAVGLVVWGFVRYAT